MKARWMTRLLQGMAILMLAATAAAQDPGIAWNDLDAEQQRVLRSFADNWDDMEPERRERLAMGADRWAEMTHIAILM